MLKEHEELACMPYDSVHTWQLRGAHGRRSGGIGRLWLPWFNESDWTL